MTTTGGKITPPVLTPHPADTVWADGRGLNVNMTVETAITCVPRAVSLALHPTSVT